RHNPQIRWRRRRAIGRTSAGQGVGVRIGNVIQRPRVRGRAFVKLPVGSGVLAVPFSFIYGPVGNARGAGRRTLGKGSDADGGAAIEGCILGVPVAVLHDVLHHESVRVAEIGNVLSRTGKILPEVHRRELRLRGRLVAREECVTDTADLITAGIAVHAGGIAVDRARAVTLAYIRAP